MNWAGISVIAGLLMLAWLTMPWGLIIIAFLIWLYRLG